MVIIVLLDTPSNSNLGSSEMVRANRASMENESKMKMPLKSVKGDNWLTQLKS